MEEVLSELEALREAYAVVVAEKGIVVAENEKLKAELTNAHKTYEVLLLEYKRQLRGLKTPSRERVPVEQLSLLGVLTAIGRFEHDAPEAEVEKAKASPTKKRKKRKGSRRNLRLIDLPSEQIVLEPADKQGDWVRIGEEIASHLEYRPASLVRLDVIRPKYKRPDDEIEVAEVPERPFPKCAAGPSLMAHVMVSKYGDHLPLHRQERIFGRQGLPISKQTLQDWTFTGAKLLDRIVDAMWEDARDNASWSATDSTGVLVRDLERCRRLHFYVVLAEAKHVFFRWVEKNDGASVAKLLEGFTGYLQCDAHAVYHELFRTNASDGDKSLFEAGCWSHARRKFFDALTFDRARALVGIGFINRLFEIQRQTYNPKRKTADKEQRARLARPILRALLEWIRNERDELPDHAPVRKAMNYVVNQLRPLCRFLRDGRVRIDNNVSELELRRLVVGRKNWTFLGSDVGADVNCTITSLIASCQLHGIEPWAYLTDVMWLLPSWDQRNVLELAPANWGETRERVVEMLERLKSFR